MPDEYAGREPVTRHDHNQAWVADLETDEHGMNRELIIAEAVDAIEQIRPGRFVDLVTHERHGRPTSYLYEAIRSVDWCVDISDRGRCSCGGYVTRVTVDWRD